MLNPYLTSHRDGVAGEAYATFHRVNRHYGDDDAGGPLVRHRKSPWWEQPSRQVEERDVADVAAAVQGLWLPQLADGNRHHHRLLRHLQQCASLLR